MRTENYLPAVREQYEDYPFPNVDPEVEYRFLQMMPQDSLANIVHECFGGYRKIDENFRVLVAGGGTGHALIFLAEQLQYYGARVTYIDLSKASMRIAKRRAQNRQLSNIDWHHGSLLDLPKLNLGQFDYINCTGVLHHLEDPNLGLAALKEVLKPDGGMGLMVYGLYGRQSYYHVQELMRKLRQPEDDPETRILTCHQALESLPETFFLGNGIDKKAHVKGFMGDPINLFDTFLHSTDRAYTVDEIYAFVEDMGLEFNGFTNFNPTLDEKYRYRPELVISDQALYQRVAKLDHQKQEAIAEMICANIGLHTFYTSFRKDTQPMVDDEEMIPFFNELYCGGNPVYAGVTRLKLADAMEANPGALIDLPHYNGMTTHLPATAEHAALLRTIDGRKTVKQVFSVAASRMGLSKSKDSQRRLHEAYLDLFRRTEVIDWLRVRHRSVMPYPTYAQMQGRILGLRKSSATAA